MQTESQYIATQDTILDTMQALLGEARNRDIPFKEAFTAQWQRWDEKSRAAFTSLENFDASIFFSITGVKVEDNA